jgi:hypothetical protein
MQSPANVAASPAAQCPPSSSETAPTSDDVSCADRALFWAAKYANYCKFIAEIATYIPEAKPWASTLKYTPLAAFQLTLETHFATAIAAHRRGDHQGRDSAASAVVRTKAAENGLDVTKLHAEHYSRLIRYSSLFTILAAEDSLM